MSSKFLNLNIDFFERKKSERLFVCAVRKREAPENYSISKEEVKEIIKQEFHGERDHSNFSFTAEEIDKETFNKSPNRIVIKANFNEFHKMDSVEQTPTMAQQT